MRKPDYHSLPPQTNNLSSYQTMSQRIEDHFRPTDTGLRLQQLIAYFSQLQGESVDAEWVAKFCINQIYLDTHKASPNNGRCRVFHNL